MGDTTGIPWTQRTWNPWQGCHPVSEGCANCYMYRDKRRYGQDPAVVVRSSRVTFRKPLSWHQLVLARARGGLTPEPEMVFTCSWSDFFHPDADEWRGEAWGIIGQTPHLVYQILTKRPERIKDCLPADWGAGWANVWLGVTAETQARADERIPVLLQVPAAIRFVSVEPMLEPVRFREADFSDNGHGAGWLRAGNAAGGPTIDWCIVGAESGPGARPMQLQWARDLRDQCVAAGVPFFLKQATIDGRLVHMPELDGQRWAQFPEVTHA